MTSAPASPPPCSLPAPGGPPACTFPNTPSPSFAPCGGWGRGRRTRQSAGTSPVPHPHPTPPPPNRRQMEQIRIASCQNSLNLGPPPQIASFALTPIAPPLPPVMGRVGSAARHLVDTSVPHSPPPPKKPVPSPPPLRSQYRGGGFNRPRQKGK